MCNLYKAKATVAEIADLFRATPPPSAPNLSDDVLPGYPGLVVTERGGERHVSSMTWGFPLRLAGMSPTAKPRPVNNCADLQKPMWIGLARKPEWRCLIPVTAFAEAEGPKGSKTRTWFTVKDQPIFAWAGLWRQSAEWGAVYTGVMTECNEAIRPVHDRMPVLLMPDEWDEWLYGDFTQATAFQGRCFPDELIQMERTDELWVKRKATAEAREAPGVLI